MEMMKSTALISAEQTLIFCIYAKTTFQSRCTQHFTGQIYMIMANKACQPGNYWNGMHPKQTDFYKQCAQ